MSQLQERPVLGHPYEKGREKSSGSNPQPREFTARNAYATVLQLLLIVYIRTCKVYSCRVLSTNFLTNVILYQSKLTSLYFDLRSTTAIIIFANCGDKTDTEDWLQISHLENKMRRSGDRCNVLDPHLAKLQRFLSSWNYFLIVQQ